MRPCVHVFMCMYLCVIVGEIGKLLVIYFSNLKEERRNVEVEEGREEGERGEFEEGRQKYAE